MTDYALWISLPAPCGWFGDAPTAVDNLASVFVVALYYRDLRCYREPMDTHEDNLNGAAAEIARVLIEQALDDEAASGQSHR